jgi:hypothetical protein
MANVIIRSEERCESEARMLREFGGDASNAMHRECAGEIAARTNEAVREMDRMERR